MRSIAVLAGALIIVAAAHVSITATGGYQTQTAPLTGAIALGLIIGAICIGLAWRERRFALAWCLVAALMAGELYAVIMTGERVVVAREAAQAPLREAEEARAKAKRRVDEAEAAVAGVPEVSPRLQAALAAKAAADAAAIEKSAERHCAGNCRTLLQEQVDAAQTEVAAARAELAHQRETAEAELTAARAALDDIRAPASATPLADRLGVPGWALDLVTAVLASIAANGMGATLVAFGAHGARQEPEASAMDANPQALAVEPPRVLLAPTAREHAARFSKDILAPADTTTPVITLLNAYRSWCAAREEVPLPTREVAAALDDLLARAGLEIEDVDGEPHVRGAKLRTQT